MLIGSILSIGVTCLLYNAGHTMIYRSNKASQRKLSMQCVMVDSRLWKFDLLQYSVCWSNVFWLFEACKKSVVLHHQTWLSWSEARHLFDWAFGLACTPWRNANSVHHPWRKNPNCSANSSVRWDIWNTGIVLVCGSLELVANGMNFKLSLFHLSGAKVQWCEIQLIISISKMKLIL